MRGGGDYVHVISLFKHGVGGGCGVEHGLGILNFLQISYQDSKSPPQDLCSMIKAITLLGHHSKLPPHGNKLIIKIGTQWQQTNYLNCYPMATNLLSKLPPHGNKLIIKITTAWQQPNYQNC